MDASQWRLRVTAATPGVVRVSARRHQFAVGKPVDFDVDARHVSALEYALGALAAEVVGGLGAAAKRRRIEIDHVEAVVDGQLENPLTYLEVVGETARPRLGAVALKVYVASPYGEPAIRKLWSETLPRLPLVATFERACDVTIELTLTG
jgi:hypothetical protein